MTKPLSPQDIANIKAKMAKDPEIQRLAKVLGVTVERFLEDIERQGEEVQLHDATTPAERARAEDEILAAATKGYGEAEERREALQGRRDVRLGADSAKKEGAALSLSGGRAAKTAPKEAGHGAVLADDGETRSRIAKELSAARTRR